ncbi:MAG: hypothetical protein ABFS35_23740 [Bacteroidota bacterium]
MKRLLPFFAFIFISLISLAQYENFDLSKYKLPDIKRHQLDFKFGIDNDYSSRTFDNEDRFSKLDFNQDFEAKYNYYFNSQKRQSNFSGILDTDLQLDRTKNNQENPLKKEDTDINLNFNLDNYYYLIEDKWFIHVQPNIQFSYYQNKDKLLNFDKDDYPAQDVGGGVLYPIVDIKSIDYSINLMPKLNIGYGYGRIEPVGDLRHAIYIIDELVKNNRIKRDLSEQEIILIASKISELKNQRFFDSRLRKIYEIKSIDSVLTQMGIVDDSDAVYFTSLSDIWDFGGQLRSHGTRILFDVNGELINQYFKDYNKKYDSQIDDFTEIENKSTEKYETFGALISLQSNKPIGLKWQRYLNLSPYYNISTGNLKYWYGVNLNYMLNWYLNTRTNAQIHARINYNKSKRIDREEYLSEYLNSHIQGYLSYYLSPRLRLHFYSGINNRWYLDDYSSYRSSLSFYSSIGLRYAIF